MRWVAKGILLLLLQACSTPHTSKDPDLTKWPQLRPSIGVYLEPFTYSSQLLPLRIAVQYLHFELACDLFYFTEHVDQADIIVENHQRVDLLTGQFLLPVEDGVTILGDTGPRDLNGRDIYVVRVYGQKDLEDQARLFAHELLHALKVEHDSVAGSIMNPRLTNTKDILIPERTLNRLRITFCQDI